MPHDYQNAHRTQPADLIKHHLPATQQQALLQDIAHVLSCAPLFQPMMPRWGTPLSVKMSNCGPLGWVADKKGYRYQPQHPDTGKPWPAIPPTLLNLWQRFANYPAPPEACLINYYHPDAKMGLHQDRDEEDFSAPVLSISLGSTARFQFGGDTRSDKTTPFILESGDIMRLDGNHRLAFHGVDKIYADTDKLLQRHADLFPKGGRLNLTLRRVHTPCENKNPT